MGFYLNKLLFVTMNETMIEDEPQLVPLSCNLEFQRKNIWFSQSDVTSFYESRWTTNRVVVLAYRSVAFAYLLPWILYRVIILPDLPAFSHFTGWQFFIIILYFLVASCLTAELQKTTNRLMWQPVERAGFTRSHGCYKPLLSPSLSSLFPSTGPSCIRITCRKASRCRCSMSTFTELLLCSC